MEVNAAEVAQPGRWSEIMPGSAFSYRGFQLYWAARLCAAMAIQMQAVAVGWQVYELTQRPLDLGLVGLAQFLPALGLALFTGQVADRYDRRRVLALCVVLELVCALLLLTLTAVGNANEAPIFGIISPRSSAQPWAVCCTPSGREWSMAAVRCSSLPRHCS